MANPVPAINASIFSNFDDVIPYISTGVVAAFAVVVAGNMVGVAMAPATAAGQQIAVRVKGAINGYPKDTTQPWTAGQALFWDNVNLQFTPTVTPYRAGFAFAAQATADATGSVILWPAATGIGRYVAIAAATLTNPAAETLFPAPGQYTIPANALQAGMALRIFGWGQVTGQNSTNTQRFRGYIGGLAGLLLFDTGAVNAPAATPFWFEADVTVRAIGATAGITIQSRWAFGTAGTAQTIIGTPLVSTIDTTAAQVVGVSDLASASSAGNTARLDGLIVGQ